MLGSTLSVGSQFDNVFFCLQFIRRGERIQITPKAGNHRPTSETPLNGVSLAGRWWLNIECWPGSFVIFQGFRTSTAKETFSFVIFREGGGSDPGPAPLDPCMT